MPGPSAGLSAYSAQGSWLHPGEHECLILEKAGYEKRLVSLLTSLNKTVGRAVEVKLEPVVKSAQQRAWHRVRAQSTASLVTVVPGRVLPVSMFLALMMELALRRFGGGGLRDRASRGPQVQCSRPLLPCFRSPRREQQVTLLPQE